MQTRTYRNPGQPLLYGAYVGLATDLGYVVPPPRLVQRTTQTIASTRAGAWLFAHSLATMDRIADRLTGGRTSIPRLLAGLPVLVLTTTGRRSGQERASHLIAVPIGDTLALLGTNFGQPHTPAWVLNLEAEPRARVTYRQVSRDVVARAASEAEQVEIMKRSASVYTGYLKYQQRITGRRLRIFVLD